MEENHALLGKEKAVSLPLPPSVLKSDTEDVESKKQNCLCAPTTHAGSFRCRLHRRPPPSPVLSQHAVKKGLASQKSLSPKVKLALHHKLKQGCGKRTSSCSTSSRLQQDLPGLSRLSRASAAKEQTPSSWSDQEALTTLWKTSSTGDEALESVNQTASSEARGEAELSSAKKKSYIRPLVELFSNGPLNSTLEIIGFDKSPVEPACSTFGPVPSAKQQFLPIERLLVVDHANNLKTLQI